MQLVMLTLLLPLLQSDVYSALSETSASAKATVDANKGEANFMSLEIYFQTLNVNELQEAKKYTVSSSQRSIAPLPMHGGFTYSTWIYTRRHNLHIHGGSMYMCRYTCKIYTCM
jgi:hypothetical protein